MTRQHKSSQGAPHLAGRLVSWWCVLLVSPLLMNATAPVAAEGRAPSKIAMNVKQAVAVLRSGRAPLPTRSAAVSVIAQTQPGTLIEAWRGALNDPHPDIRRLTLHAVESRNDKTVLPLLRARLDHETRGDLLPTLLLTIGRLEVASEASRIAPFVTHNVLAVRAAALTALSEMGATDARRLALHILTDPRDPDPGWILRSTALVALAKRGHPSDYPSIRAVFEERGGAKHWLARSSFARVVARLDSKPDESLLPYVHDADARVALSAVQALWDVGARQGVISLLRDKLPRTRAVAIRVLTPHATPAQTKQIATLAKRDPTRLVRWTAATSLFTYEKPEGDALVIEGLGAEDPAIWSESLSLLMKRTGMRHGRDQEAWRDALKRRRKASAAKKRRHDK